MSKLATTLAIARHSLQIIRLHPRLTVFPFVSMLVSILLFDYFLAPLFFGVSTLDYWRSLAGLAEAQEAASAAMRNSNMVTGHMWQGVSIPRFAGFYLLSMFLVTFINVALYSQIIEAMNGGKVSITRGLSVAFARLPAVAAWTLVSSTIGVVVRVIQDRLGIPAKWIAALTGVTWTAASVFVIPVMINEPRSKSPFEYLRISAALLKRVWGEGLIGLNGMILASVVMVVVMMTVVLGLHATTDNRLLAAVLGYVVCIGVFMLLYLTYQVFECGMYVYATQGVAPGSFDEKTFECAWTVTTNPQAMSGSEDQPRHLPWAKLWLLLPAALAAASIALTFFRPDFTRAMHHPPHVAGVMVDLAQLGRRLNMEDLHAAGLFIGSKCSKCGSLTEKSRVMLDDKEDAGIQSSLMQDKYGMFLNFYSLDVPAGTVRIRRALEILRSRFPGHEGAINFMTSFQATWTAVPGAVSYTLEMQCLDASLGIPCRKNDVLGTEGTITGLKENTAGIGWLGEQRGRWRVSAVDASGNAGPPSDWTEFTPEL